MRSQAYEITYAGRTGSVARGAFEDCEVIVGPDTTRIRARVVDQAALIGLISRGADLGLELLDVHAVGQHAD